MSQDELEALYASGKDRRLVAYSRWVVNHPWITMLGALLLTLAVGYGAGKLSFTTDYRVFFSPENPQLQAFEELQDVYTKTDGVLFVVTPTEGDVFQPEVLDAVEDLTEQGWTLPYSIRVDSISNFQHTYAEGDDMIVEDLVAGGIDYGTDALARVREVAMSEPLLHKRLIAADGEVTGVNVTFEMSGEVQTAVPEVAEAARALAAEIEAAHPEIGIRLTGNVMLNASFAEASKQDMTTLVPLMLLGILVMMWLLVRSLAATVASLFVIIFSAVFAMGSAGWLGITLTPPSASAPTIIMTLAVADAIHIIVTMLTGMRDGLEKRTAIIESLRLNMQPVFLTSITTAIGFMSMNFSDAPPFRDLGNITAIGVMAAWLFSITFLPAMLSLSPITAKGTTGAFTRAMDRLGEFIVRRRNPVMFGMIVFSVAAVAMIPRNELNDEFVQYFDESIEFRNATDYAVDELTGIYLIQFSLPAGEANGISDPSYLNDLEAFTVWLRSQPEVLHVNSFVDVFKRLNKNMHGDDESYYRVPQERDLAAQYLLLYEFSLPYGLDLNNQVNLDKSATQLIVTLDDVDAVTMREVTARSEAWLQSNTPGMFNHGISTAIMFAHISERNIESMLGGTLIGLTLISLILLFALRSLRIGLLSLIPNLLPAGLAFGLWGLMVGQVDMAVSVVAAMALGIVVDDTVHFLSKYLRARREQGHGREEAVRYAFRSVGVALVVTTIILVAGFMVLGQSAFRVNASMAQMTAMAITLALVVDFLLLPPLLMLFDRKDRKEDRIDEESKDVVLQN